MYWHITICLGTIVLFLISQPLVCTGTLLFLGQLLCFPFPNHWYVLAHYFSWDNYFVSHFPTLGMYWHITFLGTIVLFLISQPLVCTGALLFLGQLFCFSFPNPWYVLAHYISWGNYFVSHFPTLGMYWHITFLGTIVLFPISHPLVHLYVLAHYFSWDNFFVSHFPTLGMYWHITFLGTTVFSPFPNPIKKRLAHWLQ